MDTHAWLDGFIRNIPDWPELGVTFRDITPLIADPQAFHAALAALAELGRDLAGGPIDKVIGIEARGFIFGAPVALLLGAGFVPARKAGKLPAATHAMTYNLEYGQAALEIHRDALLPGERVLIVDDVLATGGTMLAASRLVTACGAAAVAQVVVLELIALGGRRRVAALCPEERIGALRAL